MYTLGELHKNRNNGTVFEEMSEPIVDLKVANIRFASPIKLQIQYCYSLIVQKKYGLITNVKNI